MQLRQFLSIAVSYKMGITFPYFLPLVLLAVRCAAAVDTCPNRNYCQTSEIKYRSFEKLRNTYFNSTNVVKSSAITDQTTCLRDCTTSPKCQSINHYLKTNTTEMMCDLVDGNRWSNATDIIPRQNSTHFYIKVSRYNFQQTQRPLKQANHTLNINVWVQHVQLKIFLSNWAQFFYQILVKLFKYI